ncbi:MAG: hypothetical protein N2559_13835 [Anaerolineae bacterium]|nr:hypothetical protein [Anaerolineae bacterium]
MKRVIVTIHGTGRTTPDFWAPQVQAIAEHLGHTPPHRPVWWGDLIDVGAKVWHVADWLNARVHTLARVLLGRPARRTPRRIARAADFLHRLMNGIAGVLAFFVFKHQRAQMYERLRATLRELTHHGYEIVLVSESLGCLVAFDVLRAEANQYNLLAWVTLGCALRILVQSNRRSNDLGAITPQTLKQWINVYAPRDPVAAPIASVFPNFPIRDERLDGARTRLEAHNYWRDPRVAALIAHLLK